MPLARRAEGSGAGPRGYHLGAGGRGRAGPCAAGRGAAEPSAAQCAAGRGRRAAGGRCLPRCAEPGVRPTMNSIKSVPARVLSRRGGHSLEAEREQFDKNQARTAGGGCCCCCSGTGFGSRCGFEDRPGLLGGAAPRGVLKR